MTHRGNTVRAIIKENMKLWRDWTYSEDVREYVCNRIIHRSRSGGYEVSKKTFNAIIHEFQVEKRVSGKIVEIRFR